MTVHTPAFLGVGDYSRNLFYVHATSLSTRSSGTQQGMARSWVTLSKALVRMVTHPSTNQACDCLAMVINHEMLAPSY